MGLSHSIQLKCEEIQEATGLDVRLRNGDDTGSVPPDVALCVYRVAQEALNNVVRHSGARRVDLSLHCRAEELLLEVVDNGRGFASIVPSRRSGLASICARARPIWRYASCAPSTRGSRAES